MRFTFFSFIFISLILFSAFYVSAEENQYMFEMKYDYNDNISLFNYDDSINNIDIVSEKLNIFKADFETAQKLKEMGIIKSFEEDAPIHLSNSDSYSYNDSLFDSQWYFQRHNFGYAKSVLGKGKGVRIGIIDSGVTLHPDFNTANIEKGYNLINTDKNGNYIDPSDSDSTKNHGTQVASVICSQSNNKNGIAGIAEDVTVVPFVVCQSGQGKTSHIIKAIENAVDSKCDVINLSLDVNKKSDSLQKAIDYANENKVIVVAAAGNIKTGTQPFLAYPACCENVISVASIDSDSGVSSFSNSNNYVDISAAGRNFTLANSYGNYSKDVSGTSFSAPIISGFAVLLKEKYPDIDSKLFLKALKAGSEDISSVGYDVHSGFGVFNAKETLNFLDEKYDFFISLASSVKEAKYDFFVSPVFFDKDDIKVKVFGNLSGVLLFAVYDENDKLKYIDLQNFQTENDIFCKSFDYSLLDNKDNRKIKIFAFDNIYNMTPLGKARLIEI